MVAVGGRVVTIRLHVASIPHFQCIFSPAFSVPYFQSRIFSPAFSVIRHQPSDVSRRVRLDADPAHEAESGSAEV
jgi:hypothetical protein